MKKIKMELIIALSLTFFLSILVIYVSQPRHEIYWYKTPTTLSLLPEASWESSDSIQIVKENIQGELRKGSFEVVIGELRNLTFHYGGRVPYLNMIYENELWRGWLNCKIPTENVTLFTFDVRKLINEHGKVTYITISVTEEEVNQTGQPERQLSEVNISLKEFIEGESPIISQLGTVISYLTVALTWIVQGVVLGVPLCFVSLGIVMLVDRVLLPVWKRQLRGRSLNKSTA